MSFALLGIIALQANWIIHDIRLKEQQFDQGVTLALNDVVAKIETGEVYNVVTRNSFRFSSNSNGITINEDSLFFELMDPPPPPFPPEAPEAPVPHEAPEPKEEQESEDLGSGIHIHQESKDGKMHTVVRFNAQGTKELIDTIAFRHEVAGSLKIRDSLYDIAFKTEEKLRIKMQKLSMVMDKMAFEFGVEQNNILSRIDPKMMDTLIAAELLNKGISIPYNFGIWKRSQDSLVYAKVPDHVKDLLESKHRAVLFPNDLFSKPDYLLVSFPGRMNYVLSSLWLMLAGSAVFTLIIIMGFAYTIYVIFRQKKLSDIKTDFINNMTHEFKTPIATISLAVDSINDPRVYANVEKINYFTGIIKEENKRMNAQVENVLRMAQLEKGELELKQEQVNIHDVIEQSIEFIKLQVNQKAGHIYTHLEAANPVVVGDLFHLSNVMNNLLDNANKYSPENPDITIETENNKEGLLIHVTDKGMGMSEGTQEKIFEKFYRLPTGNIHNIKGFGLGLSYVKAIIDSHKGYVVVKSEVDKGSRFTIFLPF